MHCTRSNKKEGMTLVELLISVTIFGLLGAAIWTNVYMHGKSFIFNRGTNLNSQEASFVINRLANGGASYWGLRTASKGESTVTLTGVNGSDGQQGWRAVVRHTVDLTTEDLPTVMDDVEQWITFNPVDQTIDVDGVVVGENVTDSYFRIQGDEILLGVEVAPDTQGKISVLETQIRMRNL
ncbi:prepilin-type N-terminal cleavage/methylation domain-containing protein [Kiritimatiellota bacterium B12222]|nr:prepilin-type N-terminal cleavage/methylation domain-containing protein [Kiritimatiellota bacterium B12222]